MSPLLAVAGIVAWLLGPLLATEILIVGPDGPYRSIAEALAAARDGDTIEVRGGTHPGGIVVERSVSLIGVGRPVLDGGGRGTVIALRAPRSRLSGFVIRSSGSDLNAVDAGVAVRAAEVVVDGNRLEDVLYGISLDDAPHGVLRNNEVYGKPLPPAERGDGIRLWYSSDVRIEGNRVEASRDCVVWYSAKVRVLGNQILNGRYGLHFMTDDDAEIANNVLRGNSVGAYLMYSRGVALRGNLLAANRGPSGFGLGLKDVDDLVADENWIVDNRVGAWIDGSPRSLDAESRFHRNVFAFNDIGIALQPAVQRNSFWENDFHENLQQVSVQGGGTLRGNHWNESGRGNHWSDYRGYDLDGDGIGDVPYRVEGLVGELMDRRPELRLLQFSLAAGATEFAGRAFPGLRPPAKLVDDTPLVAPPTWSLPPSDLRVDPRPALGAGGGLLALAAAIVGLAGVRPRSGAVPVEIERSVDPQTDPSPRRAGYPLGGAPAAREGNRGQWDPYRMLPRSGRRAGAPPKGYPARGLRSVPTVARLFKVTESCSRTPRSRFSSFLYRFAGGVDGLRDAIESSVDDAPPVQELVTPRETSDRSTSPALHVEGLTKRFNERVAVDGFSCSIGRGEVVALWGANGAGKTTIVRCILGLLPSSGTVAVAGHDARRDGRAARASVGYVPQEVSLHDDLTVAETVRLYAGLRRVPEARAIELLQELGLVAHVAKPVGALSGGLRQRLAFALALAGEPALLLLDEPTSNLDREGREHLIRLIGELRGRGVAVLVASHRLDEVEALADRVLVMDQGRVAFECPPGELAQRLGLHLTLRLTVPDERRARALAVLRDGGIVSHPNGRAISVSVPQNAKALPIRLLEQSGIPVGDFEIAGEVTSFATPSPLALRDGQPGDTMVENPPLPLGEGRGGGSSEGGHTRGSNRPSAVDRPVDAPSLTLPGCPPGGERGTLGGRSPELPEDASSQNLREDECPAASSVPLRLPDPRTVWILLRKELRDALRNRWIWLFAVGLGALSFLLGRLALASPGGALGFSRAMAGMINLTLLFVPLVGLALGAQSVAGERERRTLGYLLAQPITRTELLLSKYLGLALAMAAAIGLGFGGAAVALASSGISVAVYGYLVALALLLGVAALSIGLLVSMVTRRGATGLGVALFIWFALVLLGDLGLMGTAVALQLPADSIFLLALANPLQVYKLAGVLAIRPDLEVLGPAGLYGAEAFGPWLAAVLVALLGLWVPVPLLFARWIFVRRGES